MSDPVGISGMGRLVDQTKHAERATQENTRTTARATQQTQELIKQMVQHAITTADAAELRERQMLQHAIDTAAAAEEREAQMLRWTRAGVLLSAIAALASILAILVTVLVAP